MLDPEQYIDSGIAAAEVLAEAVESLLAERERLARQLREVRGKNRELRRGPRIVGEPEVYVVPHDLASAVVFSDPGDAAAYAQARGQGWEPEDAIVCSRSTAANLIAEQEALD